MPSARGWLRGRAGAAQRPKRAHPGERGEQTLAGITFSSHQCRWASVNERGEAEHRLHPEHLPARSTPRRHSNGKVVPLLCRSCGPTRPSTVAPDTLSGARTARERNVPVNQAAIFQNSRTESRSSSTPGNTAASALPNRPVGEAISSAWFRARRTEPWTWEGLQVLRRTLQCDLTSAR